MDPSNLGVFTLLKLLNPGEPYWKKALERLETIDSVVRGSCPPATIRIATENPLFFAFSLIHSREWVFSHSSSWDSPAVFESSHAWKSWARNQKKFKENPPLPSFFSYWKDCFCQVSGASERRSWTTADSWRESFPRPHKRGLIGSDSSFW